MSKDAAEKGKSAQITISGTTDSNDTVSINIVTTAQLTKSGNATSSEKKTRSTDEQLGVFCIITIVITIIFGLVVAAFIICYYCNYQTIAEHSANQSGPANFDFYKNIGGIGSLFIGLLSFLAGCGSIYTKELRREKAYKLCTLATAFLAVAVKLTVM